MPLHLPVPGPGELFLASQEVFGPTFSSEHRAQAIAAYRIRGTRVALLRYVRHSILEARGLSPAVAAVRAKVLQLHGTVDEEVPFTAAERLQTQLRDSRLVPIEGASHFLMFDVPERFTSEVETFLSTQQEPSALSSPQRSPSNKRMQQTAAGSSGPPPTSGRC